MKQVMTIVCLALALAVFGGGVAEAGRRYLFTPSLSVEALYNDDVQYLGKGDMEYHLRPQLKLEIDSARTEHTLIVRADRYEYGSYDEYARTEYGASLESRHKATERLTLIGTASYDNDFTLTTSEAETAQVAHKIERERIGLGGRAEYSLTERTLVGLNLGYNSTQYAGEYVDVVGGNVGADIRWLATERLTLRGALTGSGYESEFQDGGSGAYRSYGANAGFEYDLTEIWGVFGTVGRQWSTNNLQTGTLDGTYTDSGNTFSGGVRWRYERSWGRLTFSRDTTTGLSGSTLDRNRASFEHNYRTTERSLLKLHAGLTDTKANGILSSSKNRYWNTGATWWYRMTEDSRVFIGASHRESKDLITDKVNDRNTGFLRFEFAFPEEWSLGGARLY